MTEASSLSLAACGFGAVDDGGSTGGALDVGAGALLGASDVVGTTLDEVGAEGSGSATAGAANTPVNAAPAAIVAR
ncbi:hypothetical protein ACFORH_22880 [Amycolatopsis roodepoortensis]|uniref:Uncharacterized protein n=1 Tax=Amycolatopsis roodepoortensis TaxID=700274 RepID=A0ABR9LLH0_9PSEU|nr:hypothetical protein [Amycolatopsis roodepoortensis]MBE1581511.1 hypothetical protein [Amycolatopsis roodepoortensis]